MSKITLDRLVTESVDLRQQRDELAEALRKADALRPILLGQLGYVPEPILRFCNQARAVLAKVQS